MPLILNLNSPRMHEYATSQINTYWNNWGFSTMKDFIEHIYRATMLTTSQPVTLEKIGDDYIISTPRHSSLLIVQPSPQ